MGIAVSGGGDSVALLRLLAFIAKKMGFHLEVFHVNHGLRSESRYEADWVKALADHLGLPFRFREFRHDHPDTLMAQSSEAELRKNRRQALAEMAQEAHITTIALAHQADDQIETFFTRLLRGAGPAGLAGIRPQRKMDRDHPDITLWRPLLDCSAAELRIFLREIGQDWLEDPSNQSSRYFRNRLRLRLMPLLRDLWPKATSHILHGIREIGRNQSFLETVARKRLAQTRTSKRFFPNPGSQSEAVIREMLRRWLVRLGPNVAAKSSRALFIRLLDLLHTHRCGRRVECGGGQIIRTNRGLEFVTKAPQAVKVPTLIPPSNSSERALRPETRVRWRGFRISLSRSRHKGLEGGWVARELATEGFVVRSRRPGDLFHPKGAPGKKKLAKWLIDKKIPSFRRDSLSVIALGNRILAIPGLALSHWVFTDPGEERLFLGWHPVAKGHIQEER